MGFFKRNKGTPLKELERYHGKRVSYVVERDGHEVFRCSTDGIVCAELMSHNGADIKGRDMTTGKLRHIVVHYANKR